MKADFINFKKQRELGDIITDTFAFMRQEFKPFFNTFLKIVGPYILVLILVLSLYLYYAGNTLDFILNAKSFDFNKLTVTFSIAFFYLLSVIVVYTLSQSTVLHYIKSYNIGQGVVDFDTIQKEVYASFWSFIGLGVLVIISIMVGFMVCILPGVYLYVPLALSFSILVFNQKGATDSYSYSFTLIKDEWWITFATVFVIGLIVGIASYAFSVPIAIYQWIKMGVFSGEVDAENMLGIFKDPIYILLNVIATLGKFLLNLISVIASVLIYFNLNEKKNFTGTFERIDNLGASTEL